MKQLLDKLHESNEKTAKIHRGTIDAIKDQTKHVEQLNKTSENNGQTQKVTSLLAAKQIHKIDQLNKTVAMGILADQKNLLDAQRKKKAEAALNRSETLRDIQTERTSHFSRDRFFSRLRERDRNIQHKEVIEKSSANLGVLRDSVRIAKSNAKMGARRLRFAVVNFVTQRRVAQETAARMKILVANVMALRKKIVGDGNQIQQVKEALALKKTVETFLSIERGIVDKFLNFVVNRIEGGITGSDFKKFVTFFTKNSIAARKEAKQARKDAKEAEKRRLKMAKAEKIDRKVDAKEAADEERRRRRATPPPLPRGTRPLFPAAGEKGRVAQSLLSQFSDDAFFKALGITTGTGVGVGAGGTLAAKKTAGPIARFFKYLNNLQRLFLGIDNGIRSTTKGGFRKGGMNKFERGVKSLGQFFRSIPRFARLAVKFFPVFGKLLGPIYLIIEALIGLFTGFKEAFKGEGNFMEKTLNGLFFSIRNFVSNIIGGTLDLLKDIVVFIIDIFGGDPESGLLKEFKDFSIKDLIMDYYNALKEPLVFFHEVFTKGPAAALKGLTERLMKKGDEGNIFAEMLLSATPGVSREKVADSKLQKRIIEMYGADAATANQAELEKKYPGLFAPKPKQRPPRGRGRGRGTGKELMEKGSGVAPQIINVTNNSGGNSSTTVTSQQSQNVSSTTPIVAGSAMAM